MDYSYVLLSSKQYELQYCINIYRESILKSTDWMFNGTPTQSFPVETVETQKEITNIYTIADVV